MQKVGIFTLFEANNIGAFLQAWSMQKVLKENGFYPFFAKRVTAHTSAKKSEKFSLLKKVWRYAVAGDIRKLRFKIKSNETYRKSQKQLHIETNSNEFWNIDAAVIGSDEVWNVATKGFVHHPEYFAHKIKAPKKVAYAPCAGSLTVDKFKTLLPTEDFSDFTAISARDFTTQKLAESVTSRSVVRVVDPTFLTEDFGIEIPICNHKNFVLVYSYGLSKTEEKEVWKFAKKRNLKLLSVGTYNSWCDENIIVSPAEFLSYLNAADCVVTSTFHGFCLSVKMNKPLFVYAKTEKVLDAIRFWNLEERMITENRNLETVAQEKINYESVNQKIKEERAKSLQFLLNALKY